MGLVAVETLMQASELSDDEAVDQKVIEATKEMEKVRHAATPSPQP